MDYDENPRPEEVVRARVFLARERAAQQLEQDAGDLRMSAALCKVDGRGKCDPFSAATAEAFTAEAARLRSGAALEGVDEEQDVLSGVNEQEQLGAVTRTVTETTRTTEDRTPKVKAPPPPRRKAKGR